MAELIYTPNPGVVPRFLKHIQSAGVPERLSTRYLEAVGFKSKNDRYVIGVMKSLRFIDANGAPTQRWNDFRDRARGGQVLAEAVREAYSDLYATYPDAERKDVEAIRNFFSARTKVAESTLKLAVQTFKNLASEADFKGSTTASEPGHTPPTLGSPVTLPAATGEAGRTGPSVHINIELHLPETEKAEVYEKLFAAMRKHILE